MVETRPRNETADHFHHYFSHNSQKTILKHDHQPLATMKLQLASLLLISNHAMQHCWARLGEDANKHQSYGNEQNMAATTMNRQLVDIEDIDVLDELDEKYLGFKLKHWLVVFVPLLILCCCCMYCRYCRCGRRSTSPTKSTIEDGNSTDQSTKGEEKQANSATAAKADPQDSDERPSKPRWWSSPDKSRDVAITY